MQNERPDFDFTIFYYHRDLSGTSPDWDELK